MAVAHDAASESHTGTTGSASEASFTFSHNPVGTPRAALVFVLTILATPKDTGVTYDGQAMTLVSGGEANDTAGEPGTIRTYFLDNVPATDPANVVVSRTNDATVMYAVCATVTAAGAVEVTGIVLLEEQGTFAEQNVDDGSPGTNSERYAFGYYGGASPPPQGTNSTLLFGIDFTAFGANFVRRTNVGQGSLAVGFTQATSDDRAGVHIAVREAPAQTVSPGLVTQTLTALGPRVDQEIDPGLQTRLLSAIAPSRVDQEVDPGLLAQALTAIAPVVQSVQTVSPGLVTRSLTAIAPARVDQEVLVSLLAQLLTATAPSRVDQSVNPGLASQPISAIAPSRIDQQVAMITLTQLLSALAPRIDQQVVVLLVSQPISAIAPTITSDTGGQTVSPGLVSRPLTAIAPSMVALSVEPALLTRLITAIAPSVQATGGMGAVGLAPGGYVVVSTPAGIVLIPMPGGSVVED